jgi:hypothetical protein
MNKSTTNEANWKDTIHIVSDEQLRDFVLEYAARDPKFRNDLLAHFSGLEPNVNAAKYEAIVSNAFRLAGGKYGYIDYDDLSVAMGPIDELLQKAYDFIEKGVFTEAFFIASAVAPQCIDIMEEIDDSNGECGGAIDEAFRITKAILEKSTDEKLKKEVYNWVLDQLDNHDYENYGCSDVLEEVFLTGTQTPEEITMAIETVDQQIERYEKGEGWSKQYHIHKYLQYKIRFLTKDGKFSEAEKIIDENLHMSEFRKIRVDEQIAVHHFDEAISMIMEGIKIAEQEDLPGITKSWKEKLLSVYQQPNDIENIRKTATDLFFSGRYEMNFYRILKDTWFNDDWLKQREKIIALLSSKPHSESPLANIYIEEKLWNNLFKLVIQDPGINTLMNYSGYLKNDYSQELIGMFKPLLRKYAERNTGRPAYQELVRYMKEMAALNGGVIAAKALKAELLITYKNRQAMKQELSHLWNE